METTKMQTNVKKAWETPKMVEINKSVVLGAATTLRADGGAFFS